MPQFRRKKASKSFPVKVCTLDAELEFNLEVRILTNVLLHVHSNVIVYCIVFGMKLVWYAR